MRMRFEKKPDQCVIDHFGPGRIFHPRRDGPFILAADVARVPMFLKLDDWLQGTKRKFCPRTASGRPAPTCRQVLSQYQTTQKD